MAQWGTAPDAIAVILEHLGIDEGAEGQVPVRGPPQPYLPLSARERFLRGVVGARVRSRSASPLDQQRIRPLRLAPGRSRRERDGPGPVLWAGPPSLPVGAPDGPRLHDVLI